MSFFEKLKDNQQKPKKTAHQYLIEDLTAEFLAKGGNIAVSPLKGEKTSKSTFIKAFSPKFKQYRKNHPKTDIDSDPDKPLT